MARTGWDKAADRAEKGPVTAFVAVLAIVVVCLAIGGGVWFFVLNPATQAARVVNKTIDADNVLYNYEWFKRQAEAIPAMANQAMRARTEVAVLKSELGKRDTWHRDDRIEVNRLNAVALGIEQMRDSAIKEYNARSQMANRELFKTNDLPDEFMLGPMSSAVEVRSYRTRTK